MVKAVGKRMRGECLVAGAGAPGSGAPRILFLTVSTPDILRYEVHFSCSVGVLRRDSISAHVWYGSYELIWGNPQNQAVASLNSYFPLPILRCLFNIIAKFHAAPHVR